MKYELKRELIDRLESELRKRENYENCFNI